MAKIGHDADIVMSGAKRCISGLRPSLNFDGLTVVSFRILSMVLRNASKPDVDPFIFAVKSKVMYKKR